MSTTYKIHPAIGVARLGTAQPDPENRQDYYVAPTEVGALPTDPSTGDPATKFRNADGKLLKQAAQFQVYAYEKGDPEGKPVVLGAGGIKAVEWTVHLANKKAAWYQFQQLTGSGPWPEQPGPWPDPALKQAKSYLENGPAINPLRVNEQVLDRQQLILDPGQQTVGNGQRAAPFNLPVGGPTTNPKTFKPNLITHLGSLYAEDAGTLLVFGGDGNSGTTNLNPPDGTGKFEYATIHYANNAGWFDDIADGPVFATLILDNGQRVEVDASAWCLAAPPKYAPQIVNMVTLFDTIFDIAVREQDYRTGSSSNDLWKDGTFNPDYVVDYEREIVPLLRRPDVYKWVVDMSKDSLGPQHNADKGHKQIIETSFDRGPLFPMQFVRQPNDVNLIKGAISLMPRLAGDAPFTQSNPPSKYLTLTQTQFFLLTQWFKGEKVAQTVPDRKITAGEAIDQGVLNNCVGGAFCPGIEITWICRNAHIYSEPFRINAKRGLTPGKLNPLNGDDNRYQDGVEPGDLSKYMAQPWQADFNECSSQGNVGDVEVNGRTDWNWWWWPAQRPYNVIPDKAKPKTYADWTRGFASDPINATFSNPNLGDMQMVIDWQKLGFLKDVGTAAEPLYVESERQALTSPRTPPLA